MSHSRKKHHFIKDHHAKTTKERKNIANRVIRRDKNFDIKGSAYKKRYPSWDICDYCWVWTEQEAIDSWYEEESDHFTGFAWRHSEFGTLENWLNYYKRCVVRK